MSPEPEPLSGVGFGQFECSGIVQRSKESVLAPGQMPPYTLACFSRLVRWVGVGEEASDGTHTYRDGHLGDGIFCLSRRSDSWNDLAPAS